MELSGGARATDVATLAGLLHETEEHHGHYVKTHADAAADRLDERRDQLRTTLHIGGGQHLVDA